jgi:large subunit ribosomal protein L25
LRPAVECCRSSPDREVRFRRLVAGAWFLLENTMKFVAYERTLQGTGASRRLRTAGKVPGIVYGAGAASMIELDHNALFFALKKEAFHSSLLEMELAGKTQQVLLRDYQMHPYKPLVLHIDFQRVDSTTKVTKKVPLHFINEENSPAVKTDGCVVNHVVTELLVQCLASQLPEYLTVDLGGLSKGQSLHVNDINLPEGTKVVTHGKPNPVIVSASVRAAAEEEAAPAADAAAAPAAAPAPAKGGKDAKPAKPAKDKK